MPQQICLPKKKREQYPQNQDKSHSAGAGVAVGATVFVREPDFRVDEESALVSVLEQEKNECSYCAIDKMSDQGGKQRGDLIGAPVANSGKDKKEKRQRLPVLIGNIVSALASAGS